MVTPPNLPRRQEYPRTAWIRSVTHDPLRGWVRVWVVAKPGHEPHEVMLTDTEPGRAAWCTCKGFTYRGQCRHARIAELAFYFEKIYDRLGDAAAATALDEAYEAAHSQGVHNPRETAIRRVCARLGHPAPLRLPDNQ